MKEVIIKILLIAIALSAFTYFVVTGLWGDSKTTDRRKDYRSNPVRDPAKLMSGNEAVCKELKITEQNEEDKKP